MSASNADANALLAQLPSLSWQQRLAVLSQTSMQTAFSTSFSLEDQVITYAIAKDSLPIRLFTLDTERLFEETKRLHLQTLERYNITIDTYFPNANSVQEYVKQNGMDGFYDSVENRMSCCHIRKVEPLGRALSGVDIWISGLRHVHSEDRANRPMVEWDEARQLIKCYPLLDMDDETLWQIIREQHIPYNPLAEQGYLSIGCAPCTRAVQPGAHPRSGRWWWEQSNATECGLHVVDGKLTRIGEAPNA